MSSVAKAIVKPLKSKISSPIRAVMTTRREVVENGDDIQRSKYAEVRKTIKRKQEWSSGNTTKKSYEKR